jgi:cell division septation protein DedD
MRIDYSEPKKAYVTPQGTNRPRKEPTGLFPIILIVTGVITFVAGFGTGWFLSQKSAKKSFQAATEQISLENSAKTEPAPVPKPTQPPQQPTATATSQPDANAAQPPAAPGTPSETPLSFYKTLPNGQKGNVLGSGINTKDERPKQPLQAPVPASTNKPTATDAAKPATDKPSGNDKSSTKSSDSSSFTVQVASYPLKSEAEAQKSKLAAKGYHVFIIESNQGDKGIWYRVRVGRKLDQEAAKELAGKLGRTALVIPDRD